MEGLFRTTPFGQLLRLVSGNSLLRYPDEVDSTLWKAAIEQAETSGTSLEEKKRSKDDTETSKISSPDGGSQASTREGNIALVGWYGTNDPEASSPDSFHEDTANSRENPQNWPREWKLLALSQMFVLNFGIYIGSSIYVPGEAAIMGEFGVSETVATLGLSMYTVGYGLGPMLWSPLSEIPFIGRSSIFFWTLVVFVLLQLGVGFAPNIATFLVFRTLTGFFGSPCLATGAGTIADMFALDQIFVYVCIWSSFGVLGPIFGPIVGGYVAPVKGWSWTIWIFTWLCSLVLVVMFFFLPETSGANILHNRAKRLRRLTGSDHFRSQSEIDARNHTTKDHLMVLARAFTLIFTEPIVLLMDLYTGLLYGTLFIWFESFPIVFGETYGFDTGQQGLVFLGIFVGSLITALLLILWIRAKVVPRVFSPGFEPEMLLPPAFAGCLAFPICLFWYGWSARQSIHWIMPIIGTSFFGIGIVTLFNSVFNYLAMTYPSESASVFAGNALFRAAFGASFPLFARTFFRRLGIGAGNSLLGGIATCFIPVTFVLYRYGRKIRRMSKNARHDV